MSTPTQRQVALLEIGFVDSLFARIDQCFWSELVSTFAQCAKGLESDLASSVKSVENEWQVAFNIGIE
jgi:hypothetical protein